MSSARFLKAVRLTHLYSGVFLAPAILFFALTGALQTFSLHETTNGSSYQPARWIVVLAQLHKKQTTVLPVRRQPQVMAKPAGGDAAAKPEGRGEREAKNTERANAGQAAGSNAGPMAAPTAPKRVNTLAMRIFFLAVALGLFTSTLTGLYMSYRYARSKVLVGMLLVAGVVVPVLLVLLQR